MSSSSSSSNNPNLCSYPDDLFSQFAFRGNGCSRFRSTPAKSDQRKPTVPAEDFTQTSEPNHQASGHEIPILTLEDLQDVHQSSKPNHEIPILTLEDLHNAKPFRQTIQNPRSPRTILNLYRKFGFDIKLVQKTSPLVRHSEAVQHGVRKGEPIVSRYFQSSEDEDLDSNVTKRSNKRLMVGDYSGRGRNDVAPTSGTTKANQHSVGTDLPSFQNSGKNQEGNSFKNSKPNQEGERVVSRFFQKSAKQQAVNNQEGAEESNQCARCVKRKRKPAKERKQTSKRNSSRPRTTLSAAELFLEAYRRKSSDDTWDPPPSEIRLLQQDHAYDPWRVLLICLLLNRTSGRQVFSLRFSFS